MQKKFYYVYKLTITDGPMINHFYIGQHSTNNLNDNYHSSSSIVNDYIKQYKNSYKMEILKNCDNATENSFYEREYIRKNINDTYCLNQIVGAAIYDVKEETVEKISNAAKKRIGSLNSFYGKHHSEETKQKVRESKKHLSDESRKRMSEAQKGKIMPEETKQKISKTLKGRQSPMKGKHMSESTRKKMSEAHKGKPSNRKGAKMSEEWKLNHKKAMTDRNWVNDGNNEKFITKDEIVLYLNKGYKLGRL